MRTPVQEARPRTRITNADRIMAEGVSSVPTRSFSKIIAIEKTKGLSRVRVRVGRIKETRGLVDGQPMTVVTTQYLDGHERRIASTRDFFQEDEMPFDAVPVKTKDVTDFGRLSSAAKALASSMATEDDPSPEQVAVFVQGYHNLLEWRRKAREQITRAEGEIEMVEILLTQML